MRAARDTKAVLTIALVLAGEFAGVGRSAAAGSPETNSTITIHVHNYAKVDDKTLEEAEKVAAEIFRKAGVGIRWVDFDLTSADKHEKPVDEGSFTLTHIQLSIFPREMAERLDLPGNATGLAPGRGTDRHLVYVFYNRVEAVSQRQLRARIENKIDILASKPEILGHAIAHEIGHLLLNLESHSATGIMRGGWDLRDLRDAASGSLIFTSQQAEVIRAETVRRAGQQETIDTAGIESRRSTR
jgi:hypothetical protein